MKIIHDEQKHMFEIQDSGQAAVVRAYVARHKEYENLL